MSNINKKRVRQRVSESSVREVTKSSSGGSSSSDYASNLKGRPILDFSKIVVPDIVSSVTKQTAKPQSRCYGNRKHKLMKEHVNRFVASTPVYSNAESLFSGGQLSPINIITDLFYHGEVRSTPNSPSSAVRALSFSSSEENIQNIHPINKVKPTKNKSTIENQASKTVDRLKGNQRETITNTTYDFDRMSVSSEASVDTNPYVDMEMVLSDEKEHVIGPKKNRKPTVKSSLKKPSKRNILKIDKNTFKSTKIKTNHFIDPTKDKNVHVDLRSHKKDAGLSEALPRSTAKENVDPSELLHAIKSTDKNTENDKSRKHRNKNQQMDEELAKFNEPTPKHLRKNNLTVVEGTNSSEPTPKHLRKNNLTVIEEGTRSNEPTPKHLRKNNLTVVEEGTKSAEATHKRLNTSETLHRAKSREGVDKVHNKTKQTSKRRNKTSGSTVNSKRRNPVRRAVVAEENDAALDSNGVRRSKRPRVAPLKYWKGEKIVYCLDANYCLNMVDVYTLSDDETFTTKRNVQKHKDKVFQDDPVLKETKKMAGSGWPKETEIGSHFSEGALDHDTEGVGLQTGYTDTVSGVSSGVWRLELNAHTRVSLVTELYMCTTVVRGNVEFAIDEGVYRGTSGSQYIIHRGSTVTLSNVGHGKALVTYTKHGAEELSDSEEMAAN